MTTELNSNQDKYNTLSNMLLDNFEKLLESLDVSLNCSGNMYFGCCPIHLGDNKTAFNLFVDGHTTKGNWYCRSHQCHKKFSGNVLGFVRGVLSSQDGWAENNNKVFGWQRTINWICNFLKVKFDSLKVSTTNDSRSFIHSIDTLTKKRLNSTGITRDKVLQHLKVPGGFFEVRGYPADLLRSYDVGLCLKSNKGFLGRIIVPVYDDAGKYVVAWSGRSINPLCQKCDSYHIGDCPKKEFQHLYSKWKHSPSINNYLYNYWRAKQNIKKSGKIILVEGPGDVWRLEEFGINNSVAIFGTDISEQQQLILETSGCMEVLIMTDNDEPGRKASESILNKLKNSYNARIIKYSTKDPGELTKDEALVCLSV